MYADDEKTRRATQIAIGRALARQLSCRIYNCENETQREGFRAQESETASAWQDYTEQFDPERL